MQSPKGPTSPYPLTAATHPRAGGYLPVTVGVRCNIASTHCTFFLEVQSVRGVVPIGAQGRARPPKMGRPLVVTWLDLIIDNLLDKTCFHY